MRFNSLPSDILTSDRMNRVLQFFALCRNPLCGTYEFRALPARRFLRSTVAFGLCAVLWCPFMRCAAQDAPQPASVILISIDTLRADHLSAYGYTKIHTPHIDSFAQEARSCSG